MNQPPLPPDDADQRLRDALHAEAEGVHASPELLDRITAQVASARRWPVGPLLAGVAVAALVVGVVGALLVANEDEPVDTIDDPTTITEPQPAPDGLPDLLSGLFACDDSLSTVVFVSADASDADIAAIVDALSAGDGQPPTSFDAAQVREMLLDRYADDPAALPVIEGNDIPSAVRYSTDDPEEDLELRGVVSDLPGVTFVTTTDCRAPVQPSGERPTTVALVREDGWLVVIDLATGEQRELHFGGDPEAPPTGAEEGGPQFIDAVELSPDGQWVYFSTCCEPASGTTYRIPVTGGEPQQVAFGAYPRVSPDGRAVATATGESIVITPVGGGDPVSTTMTCCTRRLAWSPDGSQLAGINQANIEVPAQLVLFDWDGSSLTRADPGKPDNPGAFAAWDADGTLTTISGGGSVDSHQSLGQDASYLWLLWVDAEGIVREQASLHSGELPAVPGLPEALTADW